MTQYSGKVIRKTPVTPTQQSASGVWQLAEQAAAIKNNTWPVPGVPDPISRSLRFRSSASAYLSRTPSAASNRKTWTWSGWVKRGALSTQTPLFYAGGTSTSDYTMINIVVGDQLQVTQNNSGSTTFYYRTSAVFRDPAAWYHIVVAVDTTNATAADRAKLYVNGVQQIIGTGTNAPLNQDTIVNSAIGHGVGNYATSNYYDGYMTEINFVDGQALTPSSFGTTDTATGAWIPMPYTGTYGTNGFYLNFKDNTSTTTLGYDYSGNANNWNTNNISLTSGSTYDSMLDVPTPWVGYNTGDTTAVTRGNYAVMNPLSANQMAGGTVSVTNGNLTVADGGTSYGVAAQGTIAVTSGKWYWEVTATTVGGNYGACGIRLSTLNGTDGAGYFYFSDGTKVTTVYGGGAAAYGASYTSGAVIGVALDMDAGTLTFYKNNASQGTAYTGLSGSFNACVGDGQNATQYVWDANFGQRPFAYTPPSGYKALCTTNLPTPTITNGANYMAASTYTGTGSTRSVVNSGNNTAAISFQPDLVWVKTRSDANASQLTDSVRGNTLALASNLTLAEYTGEISINSTGYSASGGAGATNLSGWTYVAWQWKAGGTSSSNTSGSITSTVSVNQTAGFSVVTYTGTGGSGTTTVGHGLSVAPSMVIIKNRSSATDWAVYHTSLTSTSYYVLLDSTAAQASYGSTFISPGSTTLTIAAGSSLLNTSTNNYVAYCWAAVAGYSAFGSYTGNGSSDGVFVFLGFRPRFLLIKNTTNAQLWVMVDTSRNTYNVAGDYLAADSSGAENFSSSRTTSTNLDILSNGFKLRNDASSSGYTNGSGNTYIYAAFAENPFTIARAR